MTDRNRKLLINTALMLHKEKLEKKIKKLEKDNKHLQEENDHHCKPWYEKIFG